MNVSVNPATLQPPPPTMAVNRTVFSILMAISFSHCLNDLTQSLLPSIYPLLKTNYGLSFTQVGLLTLTFQITASLLQPVVGTFTDRRPMPYSLPVGMGFTLVGLLLLSRAGSFPALLVAAAMVGMGSSVFHPESSRVARMASGGRYGLAQSVFQVGGNFGQAVAPLAAAFIVVPNGQGSLAWFAILALLGICVLFGVGRWYSKTVGTRGRAKKAVATTSPLPSRRVAFAVAVLLVLIFSKYFYTASLSTYYTFYLIDRFHLPVQQAQIYLFVYLGAFALGTLVGGPIGDWIGRKYVIWFSILGVLPFTLMMPYANLFWTVVLTIPIGLILSSAFAAILVYAQELMPGRVGTISGLFFGFAFGMGGLGAAVLGQFADHYGITAVYRVCAFLPAIGLMTAFLPNIEKHRPERIKHAV
jgi:FSR family fosmidomycin resistance protein-like MFS transporter